MSEAKTTVLIPLANVSELRYVDAVRTVVRTTFLIPLANVSELRYVDAVRTIVRTTVLIKLSEVNSESLTEFRDIDAV